MRILIVEDDKAIVRMLVANFKRRGYDSTVAFDGKDAIRLIKDKDFDLVILDIGLPDMEGWEVCQEVRKFADVPILMLTARVELEDRVKGLDTGADDYLTKPFDFKELHARMESLARRGESLTVRGNELRAGNLHMNLKDHTVKYGEEEIELTRKEYALLEYFLRNRNQILSRLKILAHVWDQNVDIFTNTVDVHVASLRKKIQKDGVEIIVTVHGVGYMLKDSEHSSSE